MDFTDEQWDCDVPLPDSAELPGQTESEPAPGVPEAEPESTPTEPEPVPGGENRDFEEFVQRFPQVRAEQIPLEVWREVNRGVSLSNAYSQWRDRDELARLREENFRLAAQLEAGRRLEENRRRSTGSRSQISGSAQSEIDRIWDEDD